VKSAESVGKIDVLVYATNALIKSFVYPWQ